MSLIIPTSFLKDHTLTWSRIGLHISCQQDQQQRNKDLHTLEQHFPQHLQQQQRWQQQQSHTPPPPPLSAGGMRLRPASAAEGAAVLEGMMGMVVVVARLDVFCVLELRQVPPNQHHWHVQHSHYPQVPQDHTYTHTEDDYNQHMTNWQSYTI